MNIVDPILFHCRWQPSAPALCAPGTIFNRVSYGQLETFIHNVGRKARENGLARGSVVALFIKDPILHAVVVLGLMKIGVLTASAREMELPSGLHIDHLLADASFPSQGRQNIIHVDKDWVAGDGKPPGETVPPAVSADDPCRILLTSGSTGTVKAVIRNSRHILNRVQGLNAAYGSRLPNCSRIYLNMGLSTGIGFTFLIYTLSRGGTLLMPGRTAMDTLDALAFLSIQAMIAAPKSLAEMADLWDQVPTAYAGFDVIVSSGSLLTRTVAERVRTRLCNNLVVAYGSTEAGIAAAGSSQSVASIEGAVGYVVPGVTIDIIGASGEALTAGKEGLIRIRSDYLVNGYVGDAEATRRHFVDGTFFPGDIGHMAANGILVVSGREKTIINLGGDKMSPERIEAALTSFDGIEDAAAFGTTTPTGVQVLGSIVVWRNDPDDQALREHLRHRLPPSFIPGYFREVDSVPRTANGKIDRIRLSRLMVGSAISEVDAVRVSRASLDKPPSQHK
jgi:acyl-CoA synthetase (AMP-forming)/AMP-acid ligase II